MTLGIFFLLLTGLCWVCIGAVVSHAAEKNLNLNYILGASSLIVGSVAAVLCLGQQTPDCGILEKWPVILPVFLAGSMNCVMLLWMKTGMRLGHAGAVWGIVQSSLLCPFIMGVCVFDVQPTAPRICGLVLILCGIALFSRTKPQNSFSGYRWLLPTLGAFAASGAAQCMANLPSYFQTLPLSSNTRCMLVQFGTVGAFCVFQKISGEKMETKGTLLPVLLLSATQLLTLCCFFYNGLNRVAEAGAGSIGYPVAQGSCIVFFMLYETFFMHKKTPFPAWGAVFFLCCGIVCLAID